MNNSQKTYAMNRITQILNERKQAIKVKHTKPGVKLSHEQKVALIRAKKVSLKTTFREHAYLTEAFDFSKHERPEKVDQAAIDRDLAKLIAQADTVRDEVMLGDDARAKELIEKFARSFA